MSTTSQQPYFIRAIHQWIVDNQYTPYIMVDATAVDLQAPLEYAEEGKIVFNISDDAIRDLHLGNTVLEFSGTFSEQPWNIVIPVEAVMAIYAQENGRGLVFSKEMRHAEETAEGASLSGKSKKPDFRVVK